MKVTATAKFVGTSSRKIGLSAALIRGAKATEAQRRLSLSSKRAAGPVGKTLASAIANAENNFDLKKSDLIVEQVLVGPGPTLKRRRARARGFAAPIMKRTSHITVIVSDLKSEAASKSTAQPKILDATNQPQPNQRSVRPGKGGAAVKAEASGKSQTSKRKQGSDA